VCVLECVCVCVRARVRVRVCMCMYRGGGRLHMSAHACVFVFVCAHVCVCVCMAEHELVCRPFYFLRKFHLKVSMGMLLVFFTCLGLISNVWVSFICLLSYA